MHPQGTGGAARGINPLDALKRASAARARSAAERSPASLTKQRKLAAALADVRRRLSAGSMESREISLACSAAPLARSRRTSARAARLRGGACRRRASHGLAHGSHGLGDSEIHCNPLGINGFLKEPLRDSLRI